MNAYHRFLVFVRLDASNEERVAELERRHQSLQRLFELGRQGGGSLPGLRSHAQLLRENRLQETVLRYVDQLEKIQRFFYELIFVLILNSYQKTKF
jgi:hypothetical protein